MDDGTRSTNYSSPSDEEDDFEEYIGDGVDYSEHFRVKEYFPSFDAAFTCANEIAGTNGFHLVTSSNHTSKKTVRATNYVRCERGEKYRGKADSQESKRKNTSTKKSDCQFQIEITEVASGSWVILPKNDFHNHKFGVYLEGHRVRSKLSPEAKSFIRDQKKSQIKAGKVRFGLTIKFPDQPAPVMKQIYNENAKLSAKERGGRNRAQHMMYLASQHGYVQYVVTCGKEDKISCAFMAHPEAISMYRAYHIVVLMDSTYKTNDNEYPLVEMVGVTPVGKNFTIAYALVEDESTESYIWILQKVKSLLLNDVYPTTIVTDRELGLGTAIKDVFPMSNHLLCTWHIYNVVEVMIHSVVKNEKLTTTPSEATMIHSVVEATTPSDLLFAWDEFVRKYGKRGGGIVNYLQTTWFVHVEKFCKAYTNKVLHLGNKATSRVESAHVILKFWLVRSTLALDTLWERSHTLTNGQHIEIKALLSASFLSKIHLHEYYGRLFSLLGGSVAKRAIVFMQEEYTRRVKLGVG